MLQRRQRLQWTPSKSVAKSPYRWLIPSSARDPQTVDNDLPITDCCPGFAQRQVIAVSTREAALRRGVEARTSKPRYSCFEVMGRPAAGMAAAGGLPAKSRRCASRHSAPRDRLRPGEPTWPMSIIGREIRYGVVVVSEGVRDPTAISWPSRPRTRSATAAGAASDRWSPDDPGSLCYKSIWPSPYYLLARRATSHRQ